MPKSKPRILFVLKYRDNTYGCDDPYSYSTHLSSGLYNSAKFVVEMLAERGYEAKLVQVVDNNRIHHEIVEFQADVVIIEAYWVVPEKFLELFLVCPHVSFIIRNHSDMAFLSNEGVVVEWSLKYVGYPNVVLSCNSIQATESFRFLVQLEHPDWTPAQVEFKVPYLPNFYPLEGAEKPKRYDPLLSAGVLNVGCFGAIRPLKNQLIQALAALEYADKYGLTLLFHMNGTRLEMKGDPVRKNLVKLFEAYPQHELVFHPWMPHAEFLDLMREMDVSMQVSFSETFNIVSADAVKCGVPIVVSDEIPWASGWFKADTNDVDDIVEKIERAINFPSWFPFFNPNLAGLRRYDAISRRRWTRYLKNL